MKFKSLANAVTKRVGRQVLTARKHSPAIMFAAGVVGVAATVVLASRATLKLEDVLEETLEELDRAKDVRKTIPEQYSEKSFQHDKVVLYSRAAFQVAKLYAPSILTGIVSVSLLSGSHIILTRRNVALTAAYAAIDRGFREYRQRVIDELGPDKDREFRYAMEDRTIVEETDKGPVTKTIKQPGPRNGSPYAVFFDESNPNWQRQDAYNRMFIQCQMTWANNMLHARGHLFLNEVYDMLGVPRIPAGQVVGWVLGQGGDDYVDFLIFENDAYTAQRFVNGDEPSIMLDFNVDGVVYDKI